MNNNKTIESDRVVIIPAEKITETMNLLPYTVMKASLAVLLRVRLCTAN